MGINFHCSQVTLRHEGLPLFLRTSSRLIEWKRTNCKMITLNKISAKAGIQALSLRRQGTIKNWVPVFTGNPGFPVSSTGQA